ncbi:MAG TPA: hypothetical protein PK156_03970 [Polyangium sp.]|nr:hypothetical protein [Polyangium sp.]
MIISVRRLLALVPDIARFAYYRQSSKERIGEVEAEAAAASEVEFQVSTHRCRYEPPDIIRIWWIGNCRTDDFEQLFVHTDRLTPNKTIFVVADVSRLETIDPPVRKMVGTDPRMQRVGGVAMVGASFHIRVLMGMLARAVNFLHFSSKPKVNLSFVGTGPEALAWIVRERERLNSK